MCVVSEQLIAQTPPLRVRHGFLTSARPAFVRDVAYVAAWVVGETDHDDERQTRTGDTRSALRAGDPMPAPAVAERLAPMRFLYMCILRRMTVQGRE